MRLINSVGYHSDITQSQPKKDGLQCLYSEYRIVAVNSSTGFIFLNATAVDVAPA
jgi:hypothetical protein